MNAHYLALIFVGVAILFSAGAHASDNSWQLPEPKLSPQHQLSSQRLTADCGDWHTLRAPEWYNTVRAIFALPGSDLMWAVGESLYGPQGVQILNGMPIVCRSTDGGFYWDISQPYFPSDSLTNQSVTLYEVHFFNSVEGIAAGGAFGDEPARTAVIYKTGDGGSTWSLVYEGRKSPGQPRHMIYDIDFVDDMNGWAVGAIDQFDNIAILRTTDGGNTWTPQTSSVDAAVGQVDFVDVNVGFAIANLGNTLTTADGGAHWEVISNNSAFNHGALAMHFFDANVGLASNVGPFIFRTTNGGANWNLQYTAPRWIWGMNFADASNGWGVGEFGAIIHTEDGGISWEHIPGLPNIPDLFACVALDPDRAWVAGRSGAIGYTLDRGGFWQNVSGDRYITTASLSDLEFVNEQYGWASGARGEIVRTTDGGETWTHSIQVNDNIQCLDFVNPLRGWYTTATDVWRTDNGGTSWNEIGTLPPTVTDIEFYNELIGWASGSGAVMHRTTDGGETWDTVPTNVFEVLHAIDFVDREKGWAVGWDGTILKTSDGGLAWQVQPAAVVEPLYDVSFADELHGWVAGSKNIQATVDGGATWQVQHTVGLIGNLVGVHFINNEVGMVVGGLVDFGWVFTTDDGGATWTECDLASLEPQQKLNTVFMLSSDHVYAAGQIGWVLELGSAPTGIAEMPNYRAALEILPNRPNPFAGTTELGFRLAERSDVTIEIFDVAGRRVFEKTLRDVAAGEQTFAFDGRTTRGVPLPSGIYFQTITALGEQKTSKLVIIR